MSTYFMTVINELLLIHCNIPVKIGNLISKLRRVLISYAANAETLLICLNIQFYWTLYVYEHKYVILVYSRHNDTWYQVLRIFR